MLSSFLHPVSSSICYITIILILYCCLLQYLQKKKNIKSFTKPFKFHLQNILDREPLIIREQLSKTLVWKLPHYITQYAQQVREWIKLEEPSILRKNFHFFSSLGLKISETWRKIIFKHDFFFWLSVSARNLKN